jgi:hypothetical protein
MLVTSELKIVRVRVGYAGSLVVVMVFNRAERSGPLLLFYTKFSSPVTSYEAWQSQITARYPHL